MIIHPNKFLFPTMSSLPKHKEHELLQWLHNQHLLSGHSKYLSDVEVFFACLVHLGWLLACLFQWAEMGSIYRVWDVETD